MRGRRRWRGDCAGADVISSAADVSERERAVCFEAPGGPLGRLVDRLLLTRYLERFLLERNRMLKQVAESDEWKRFLKR